MTSQPPPSPDAWDPRVREAVRMLENAQPPAPPTEQIAAAVGLSTFHFTRLFSAQVGTGPQDYARDYFLQHAASRLRYTDDPVVEVARDFGYSGLSTFVRAFSARFGRPPATWRREARGSPDAPRGGEVRLERLGSIRCLARRYLGPRETGAAQWADFLGRLPPDLARGPRLGLAYDDPRITAPERIRYDCAVRVGSSFQITDALAAEGLEVLTTPAGAWACTDAPGPEHVAAGYGEILRGWLPLNPAWTLEGDPFLELHRPDASTDGGGGITVCLRVRRTQAFPDPNMLSLRTGG